MKRMMKKLLTNQNQKITKRPMKTTMNLMIWKLLIIVSY